MSCNKLLRRIVTSSPANSCFRWVARQQDQPRARVLPRT